MPACPQKHSIGVDEDLTDAIMAAEEDAAVELLQLLFDHINSPAYRCVVGPSCAAPAYTAQRGGRGT